MIYFIVFVGLFICLFFLSKFVTQQLSRILLYVTRSQGVTIHLLSFLFLPGVVVHELSHMFMASLLFVRVGDIEFFPQIHGNHVKLGSVQIAKTDPIRRFLIGAAPMFGGVGLLLLFFYYLSYGFSHPFSWQLVVFLYSLFEIGNTMFSSRKDMEGAIAFGIIVAVLLGLLLLLGFRFQINSISYIFTVSVTVFFQEIDIILSMTVAVNMIFCLAMNYVLKAVSKRYY